MDASFGARQAQRLPTTPRWVSRADSAQRRLPLQPSISIPAPLPGQDPHPHPLPAPHPHRTRTARGSALSAGGRRHLAAAGPGVWEGGKIPKGRGMGVAAPSRCPRGQGELGLRGPPASQGGRDAACGRRCQHPLPPAANVSCVSAAETEGKVWQ